MDSLSRIDEDTELSIEHTLSVLMVQSIAIAEERRSDGYSGEKRLQITAGLALSIY